MVVNVLLFGPLAAAAGAPSCSVALTDDRTCAAILQRLSDDHPSLRPMLASARVALNAEFASPTSEVQPTDEVAIIALVSGG